MNAKELHKKLNFIESVLCGVVPSGNYTGKKRKRQNDRIDKAMVSIIEIKEHLVFMSNELSGYNDTQAAKIRTKDQP